MVHAGPASKKIFDLAASLGDKLLRDKALDRVVEGLKVGTQLAIKIIEQGSILVENFSKLFFDGFVGRNS